jgi:endonuclease YncB( thermonuclease family)
MVKTGMAWVYRKYVTNQAYYSVEEIAKTNKIGLWSQPNPVPPWELRHPVNNNLPIAKYKHLTVLKT